MNPAGTAIDPDPSLPPLVGEFDTVADALAAAARQFADREAYVDGEQRLSYAQWYRAADGVARHFVGAGVKPGDRMKLEGKKKKSNAAWEVKAVAKDYGVCQP